MLTLSIDTSCDETAAAVTEGVTILSNTIWSQASLHAKWGGVVPNLAKREHEKRINWVVEKALKSAGCKIQDLGAVAVTIGPGLAIALEVGIIKAKQLSTLYKLPLLAVNHIEGHVLSPLAKPKTTGKHQVPEVNYPSLGIVASGGHTEVLVIESVGKYKILAATVDDALGEALDKGARMLGLGYPGGPIMESLALLGDKSVYPLPVPLIGQEKRMIFSYSGLKASLFRKIDDIKKNKKDLSKKDVCDLAASFQYSAFKHFIRVFEFVVNKEKPSEIKNILAGGGVMANITLRKLIRNSATTSGLKTIFPYTKKLYGDNAGMIGIAAHFKFLKGQIVKNFSETDRVPNLKIDSD